MPSRLCFISIIVSVVVLGSSACGAIPVVSPPPMPTPGDGAIEMGTIVSPALTGNRLGDRSTRSFFVYLPPGYGATHKRYPVLYVLHGFLKDYSEFTTEIKSAEDQLAVLGESNGLIVVFPDCTSKLGGCQYLNSPTSGNYETYIVSELVAQVDGAYRTLPDRESRGVTGCSMGGDGAARLALKYPTIFAAFASISSTYDWEHDPNWELARSQFTVEPQTWDDFKRQGVTPLKIGMNAEWFIAAAAAAAPNANKPPFYLDMPFEIVNGQPRIVPEVAEKINALDPLHELSRYLAQPVRLRGIMIYHGDQDTWSPVQMGRGFDDALTALNVDHTYLEVSNGGHCSLDWTPVLQFMLESLVH